MSLNSLLSALNSSSPKGWGGSSHTWGGKSAGFKIAKFGKKTSESQAVANRIMAGAKVKASHSNEGLLGSILGGASDVTGNLVRDVVSTAENVPSGLLKIATTDPLDTIKSIGTDYKARYGKLFHGDFGGFAHDLGKHPLSYLLDAATVGTMGTGALARVGLLSRELSTTGLSLDRAATAAGESAHVPVNLSRNPFTRTLQKGTYKALSKLPENIPLVGENAVASRAVAQSYRHDIVGMPLAEKQIMRDAYLGHFGEAAKASLGKYNHAVGTGGLMGKSTQVWKDVVLAGRPAFQINNIVGNTGMTLLQGGRSGARGIQLATRGELDKAAEHLSGSMESFGGTEKGVGRSLYRRAVNKSYNLQGRFELVDRKAVMYAASMKVPEIKAVVRSYTNKGMTEGDALAQAYTDLFKGEHGAALHREVRQKIDDTMGDYTRYTAGEQRLKKIIPFYGWNRHASRFLYATARDRPGQLLALNQLSKIGEQAHKDWGWAGTPDFMKGYLKIGGHTFDTAPLNPLKGATDTLKSVKEVVSGNVSTEGTDLSGNLNPIIAAGIQGITGKNLLTGAPIQRTKGGLLGSVGVQMVAGLPQTKLLGHLVPGNVQNIIGAGPADKSNPHYYLTPTGQLQHKFLDENGHVKLGANGQPEEAPGRHMLNPTFQSQLFTFLGIPDKGSVNIKTAQTVAKKVESDKHAGQFRPAKKRKRKTSAFKAVVNTQRSGGWGAGQSRWGG